MTTATYQAGQLVTLNIEDYNRTMSYTSHGYDTTVGYHNGTPSSSKDHVDDIMRTFHAGIEATFITLTVSYILIAFKVIHYAWTLIASSDINSAGSLF